jgi:hypothetical protein
MVTGRLPSTANELLDRLSSEICMDDEPGFEIETCWLAEFPMSTIPKSTVDGEAVSAPGFDADVELIAP